MKHTFTVTPPANVTPKEKGIILSAPGVAKKLSLIMLLLLCLHSMGVVLESILGDESRPTRILVRYFDFNGEENVPAFFSSVNLLAAAGLLYLIYCVSSNRELANGKRYWLFLSFIFVFMAIDESVQLHEHIAEFVRPRLTSDLNGLLHWAWVVPYSVVVIAVAGFFLKWVLSLPPLTRNLFVASGSMFVLGALGLEFVEGYLYKQYGIDHIYNRVMYTLEEFLEMAAVILFIYTLLQYLAGLKPSLLLVHQKGNT
ncbi:multidrug transporter [uncultured Pontibacter sp.]|uniref:multidrug transporter n=1 Tax=uncultured Pontibacter sp. TaxID=453356 RepID=UPI002627CA90|nr:multidrug transporter [uncultured Pontibacter sp.]